MKKPEPVYLSMTQAARRLGLDQSQLSKASRAHAIYAPDVKGIPGTESSGLGLRLTRYHVEHVQIIQRVLLGVTELETGWLEWQVRRNQIAAGIPTVKECRVVSSE